MFQMAESSPKKKWSAFIRFYRHAIKYPSEGCSPKKKCKILQPFRTHVRNYSTCFEKLKSVGFECENTTPLGVKVIWRIVGKISAKTFRCTRKVVKCLSFPQFTSYYKRKCLSFDDKLTRISYVQSFNR